MKNTTPDNRSASHHSNKIQDPARLAEVEKFNKMISAAREDYAEKADSDGSSKEQMLHSILMATQNALNVEGVLFNLLDNKQQTTIVQAGTMSLRGRVLPIDRTFCQLVVQNETKDVVMISEHPELKAFLGVPPTQEGGIYAGVPIHAPEDSSQAIGTLCIMDSRQETAIFGNNEQEKGEKTNMLKGFAAVLEAQLKNRAALKSDAKAMRSDVEQLRSEQLIQRVKSASKNFAEISTEDLILAVKIMIPTAVQIPNTREEAVRLLQEHLSTNTTDYESMRFKDLLIIADKADLNTDTVESKEELIALIRRTNNPQQPQYSTMKLRELLALADTRQIEGADDVESKKELIALLEEYDRQQRPDYASMKFRELLALADTRQIEGADDAESKKELIALLEKQDAYESSSFEPLPATDSSSKTESANETTESIKATQKRTAAFSSQPGTQSTSTADDPFVPPKEWINDEDLRGDSQHLPWLEHLSDRTMNPFPVFGIGDHPPIRKDDKERIECIHSYGLSDPNPKPDHFLDEICKSAALSLSPTAFCLMNIITDELAIQIAGYFPDFMMNTGITQMKCGPRGMQMCNFVVYKGKPVVLPSEALIDGTGGGLQFYSGVPLQCPTTGHTLGSFCLIDNNTHPEYTDEDVQKLKMLCTSAMHHIELRKLRLDVFRLAQERQALEMHNKPRKGIPDGASETTTYCFTDIENSTPLWEDYPQQMNEALRLHNQIIRRNIVQLDGKEVTTEGDAFFAAFHAPTDALEFCAAVQLDLLQAEWPQKLLEDPRAIDAKNGAWRGLKVRMGIHCGKSKQHPHPITHRPFYSGSEVDLAKELGDAGNGGQIIMSAQAWSMVQLGLQEQNYHCVHLGAHHLKTPNGLQEIQIIQTLPDSLASGRDFSDKPIRSHQQIELGYYEAPMVDGTSDLFICFVLVSQIDELMLLGALGEEALDIFRAELNKLYRQHSGYLCQENQGVGVIAFANAANAVDFASSIHTALHETEWPKELSNQEIFTNGIQARVGLFDGIPVEKRPHAVTGRADYFGPLLNRAARVAYSASPGRTLIPRRVTEKLTPEQTKRLSIQSAGQHALKGIKQLVDIDDISIENGPAPILLNSITLHTQMEQLMMQLANEGE